VKTLGIVCWELGLPMCKGKGDGPPSEDKGMGKGKNKCLGKGKYGKSKGKVKGKGKKGKKGMGNMKGIDSLLGKGTFAGTVDISDTEGENPPVPGASGSSGSGYLGELSGAEFVPIMAKVFRALCIPKIEDRHYEQEGLTPRGASPPGACPDLRQGPQH
jgi:hypothetical protein